MCVILSACLSVQVYALVLQIRHMEHPAAAEKVSILGISAQACLDAGICIMHLLLSSVTPGSLFYLLILISTLKLVIFCIFEMRILISIYQARFSRELSVSGSAGLRQHLATLHVRFYIALFACVILVNIFYAT